MSRGCLSSSPLIVGNLRASGAWLGPWRTQPQPGKLISPERLRKIHCAVLDAINIRYTPADIRNAMAAIGFWSLGANAQSAVPALIEIADQNISQRSRQSRGENAVAMKHQLYLVCGVLVFAAVVDRRVRKVRESVPVVPRERQ